jgi:hypothetical protein
MRGLTQHVGPNALNHDCNVTGEQGGITKTLIIGISPYNERDSYTPRSREHSPSRRFCANTRLNVGKTNLQLIANEEKQDRAEC